MKKYLILTLSVFLTGFLVFANNVMSEDLPESELDNNAVEMEQHFEVTNPDSLDILPDEVDPALEPEGNPDSDILFKEEITPGLELDGEDRIILEPGTSAE